MTEYSAGGGQPAGWYYAEGDPPGTNRYWDGLAWQGTPQVVGFSDQAAVSSSILVLAEPGQRFIAFLIDFGILVLLYVLMMASNLALSSTNQGIASVLPWVLWIAYMGFGIYNWTYLQGTTGQTIGKKQQGISLLHYETGTPVGIGMAFVRTIFHIVLWMLCFVPLLIDDVLVLAAGDHRRFSDNLLSMQVYKMPQG